MLKFTVIFREVFIPKSALFSSEISYSNLPDFRTMFYARVKVRREIFISHTNWNDLLLPILPNLPDSIQPLHSVVAICVRNG